MGMDFEQANDVVRALRRLAMSQRGRKVEMLREYGLQPGQDVVLLELAEIHARVGARDASRTAAMRAAELARTLGSAELLALAALRYGGEHVPSFELDETRIRLLEESLAAFGSQEDELVARLLRRLAVDLAFVDAARAAERADQSVAMARRIGKPGVLAWALSGRHYSLGAAERLDERLIISREMLAV